MSQHPDEYDQNYSPPTTGGVRKFLLFVGGVIGFFVFEAIAVPKVRDSGGSIDQMFFIIIGGLLGAVIVPILLNILLKKFGLKGKKPHELMQMWVGYQTQPNQFAQFSMADLPAYGGNPGQALVPVHQQRGLARYGEEEEYEDEEYEDEEYEDEEYEDEEYEDEEYEDEECVAELIEPEGLPLAENFMPSPDSLACQNVTIVGVRRFGKSNALAQILRCLAEKGFPLIIFDTEDEYEELARKRFMPRGILVGSEELRADAPDSIRYHSIDIQTAYNFGQVVLENCLQVVVNLKAWSDNEAAEIMSEMISGMENWQQHRPVAKRIPFYIAIDEITKWVPQNLGESTLSRDAIKMIQHALFDVAVRRGGKRGFGLIVAGQKYAEIDKRILQGPWKLIFCQTEKNDLERCAGAPTYLEPAVVRSLQKGESYVFCPQVPSGMFVQWPLSEVPLGGKSPGMENLYEHHRRIPESVTGVLARLPGASPQSLAERRTEREQEQTEEPQPLGNLRMLHPSQVAQANTDQQLAWGCVVYQYLERLSEPFTPTAVRRPRKELKPIALALGIIRPDAEEIIGGGARAVRIKEDVEKLNAQRMMGLLRLANEAQIAAQGTSDAAFEEAENQ